jgi:hypothetical protein
VPDHDPEKGIQGRQRIFQESQSHETFLTTGGGPNQTNRKIYIPDARIKKVLRS